MPPIFSLLYFYLKTWHAFLAAFLAAFFGGVLGGMRGQFWRHFWIFGDALRDNVGGMVVGSGFGVMREAMRTYTGISS